MANKERDELDRDPEADEETRGLEDDDFEEGDEADDVEDDELDADERLTGEVGSEGGSPGETVVTRRRGERVRGSEAGETWNPEQDRTRSVERLGEEGQPRKRNP
jgi:hypothetical protein